MSCVEPYIDIREVKIRRQVIKELVLIEKKLNIKVYELSYLINDLYVNDIIDKDDFLSNP